MIIFCLCVFVFLGKGVGIIYYLYIRLRISEFRNCVKVEMAILGFPSLIVRTVSIDVKPH